MSQHTFGGLVIGIGAVVAGIVWLGGSIARLRRRGELTTEFGASASGAYTFALTQVGCGAVLVLAGLLILAVALLR